MLTVIWICDKLLGYKTIILVIRQLINSTSAKFSAERCQRRNGRTPKGRAVIYVWTPVIASIPRLEVTVTAVKAGASRRTTGERWIKLAFGLGPSRIPGASCADSPSGKPRLPPSPKATGRMLLNTWRKVGDANTRIPEGQFEEY